MSVFDPYVEKFVPGRVIDNTGAVNREGPVTSRVGETYYVSYAVESPPEEAGEDYTIEIVHQEEHDNAYDAGKAFAKMLALAPERQKERPPEGADPVEEMAFEADVQSAYTDIIRMQVAMENHPDLDPEEIIARKLDRPPGERPR